MDPMAWVYILRCADDSYYVGSTRNLDARLAQHAMGTVDAYTEQRRPLTLAWAQEYERVDEAWAMERRIKGWRRQKREALIEGRFDALPGLSTSGSHRLQQAEPGPG